MEPRSAIESSPKLKEFFKKQPAIVVIFVHAETMRHRDPERLRIIIALVLVDTPILASLSLAEAHLLKRFAGCNLPSQALCTQRPIPDGYGFLRKTHKAEHARAIPDTVKK